MVGNADSLLKPGMKFGDYTVVRLLGAGGMGAVYLIRGDGNEFALKILDPDVEKSDAEYRRRFLFEAELAMSIHHPNLIAVYDVGRDPETGYAYIVMEYVPGGTVRDRIEKWGALPIEESCDIVLRVANALVSVDAHHVVHRDIKPDNIMFTADGVTPKLADLGIARCSSATAQNTVLTQAGYLVGSPAYMAPEQMIDSHKADIRADIHALGVTFWEMLAGRRPHPSDGPMELVARAMRCEPLPDIRVVRESVPAGIAALIARMCQPVVSRRMQKPQDVVDALRLLRRNPNVDVCPEPPRPLPRDSRTPTSAAGVCMAVGAILAGILVVAIAVVALARTVRSSRRTPPLPLSVQRLAAVDGAVDGAAEVETSSAEERSGADGSPPSDEVGALSASFSADAPASSAPSAKEGATASAADEKGGGMPADSHCEPVNAPRPDDFREAIAVELREYAAIVRKTIEAEAAGKEADGILKAVNAARRFDPELRAYDMDGKSDLPWFKPLSPGDLPTYRKGKVFLMLEMLRRECPDLLERYASEKAAAMSHFAEPHELSMADTAALLGRATGRDLTRFFAEFGVHL